MIFGNNGSREHGKWYPADQFTPMNRCQRISEVYMYLPFHINNRKWSVRVDSHLGTFLRRVQCKTWLKFYGIIPIDPSLAMNLEQAKEPIPAYNESL